MVEIYFFVEIFEGSFIDMNFIFFFNSALLGVGLAMDAFSVSLANGLNDTKMKKNKMFGVAGLFAFFQALMPLIGWVCVHTFVQYFRSFEKFIPWIALALLGFIGGKMIVEGIKEKDCTENGGDCEGSKIGLGTLLVQGVATSIDALSVGFTIADYNLKMAVVCALVIAAVTFVICFGGIAIGKKFGTKLAGKAGIFGGTILVLIGCEIFISNVFFK